MSHRAAKKIRKNMRKHGIDPSRVRLDAKSKPRFIPPFLPSMGPGAMFYPRDLDPTCGRAVYKIAKKHAWWQADSTRSTPQEKLAA